MNAEPNDPMDLATEVMKQAAALGADEVSVSVSEGGHVELSRRDGRVEQASEASTRRLSLSMMVDERYSSHSTSDLRPEALAPFLQRAVAATRFLEPDPDRALAPAELCGRGASEEALDHYDPAYRTFTPEDRAQRAEALEEALLARAPEGFISGTVFLADGSGSHTTVTSHGFADRSDGAWFSQGAMVTLSDEGGRRPEGMSHYATRYLSDLPGLERVATEAFERADEAIGSGPVASGRYPMLLLNRVVGRILGTLYRPLTGYAIHHGKSCLADKLGTTLGSPELTLLDDPTIPRGLGSTAWDDDLMAARPRPVFEQGVLKTHYLDVYHARKLGREPTTGSRSNWVIAGGDHSWRELARPLPKAILVTGFLGGNANPLTGDFSFGIRGRLLEHGEPTTKLSEMNVTGNCLTLFQQLAARADDVWVYSSVRSPTLLFDDVQFSGT